MLQVTKTVPPLNQLEGKIKTVSKIILVSIQALARRKQHAAKITIQEILSPGNTLHTDIQEALIQGQVLALPPNCDRESFRMFPCETFERHKLHVSL